ncbi:MAG: hypothetical protein HRU06_14355 [Oceanospirillaceae bacterium]|nr:hypothetical protein [Oceanospirillaceae bacterium]
MPNKLSLLCKYYAIGDIDFASYREQRAKVIHNLLTEHADQTRPLINQLPEVGEDTTLRDPKPMTKITDSAMHAEMLATAPKTKQESVSKGLKTSHKILIVSVILLIIGSISLIANQLSNTDNLIDPTKPISDNRQAQTPLTAELYKLINQKSWWSHAQIKQFILIWDNASSTQLQNLRLDNRYSQLMSDILAYEALPDELNENTKQALAALKSRVQKNY